MKEKQTLFFSYARSDTEFALRLAKDLREAGAELWIDQLDIAVGSQWDSAIEAALRRCEILLLIISKASVASNNVKDEVAFAIEEGKRIIPILLENCELPFRWRRFHYLDFTADYEAAARALMSELQLRPPLEGTADPATDGPREKGAGEGTPPQSEHITEPDRPRLAEPKLQPRPLPDKTSDSATDEPQVQVVKENPPREGRDGFGKNNKLVISGGLAAALAVVGVGIGILTREPPGSAALQGGIPSITPQAAGSAALQGGKPTEPPKIPTTGKLIVRSNVSGNTVTIDGKPVGSTGPDAHVLAPVEHEIRVEKEGYKPFETRITLVAGVEETVQARLAPEGPVAGQTLRDSLKDGSQGPEMMVIPAGTFMMGSPEDEPEHNSYEGPQQRVVISKAFALGKYEVTFAEYDRFAKATGRKLPSDSGWGRGKRPVINVSWVDATEYAEWLSRETGEKYRLPTEAEWEYAARAGTDTRYFWGNGESAACTYANGYDVSGKRVHGYSWENFSCDDGQANTAPVGSYQSNPFGLFDMSGNVYEWTCSLYKAPYDGNEQRCTSKEIEGGRVLRGGSWNFIPWGLRSAYRSRFTPDFTNYYLYTGFRLARAF